MAKKKKKKRRDYIYMIFWKNIKGGVKEEKYLQEILHEGFQLA